MKDRWPEESFDSMLKMLRHISDG